MKILMGEVIRNLRKEKGISQETLAENMGVSVQAVSKWECDNSYPDIVLLPQLAGYFGVSIDFLFYGRTMSLCDNAMPHDDTLRIVQYKGSRILSKDTYNPDLHILLKMDHEEGTGDHNPSLNVEIWGSADIQGDVSGNIKAGSGVNCGNIGGGVIAGNGVNCGNVGGSVNAGDGVSCGNVGGGVSAGDGVNCGNGSVGGAINAGNTINCGNVSGSVSAGDCVRCGDIYGDIHDCGSDIHCHSISGNVQCEGNVIYEKQ